jgi:multidrug resistance efflux pump
VDLLSPVQAGQAVAAVLPADLQLLEAQAALSQVRLESVRATLEPRFRRDNNEISFLRLRLEWLSERVALASLQAQVGFFEAEYQRILSLGTNVLGVVSTFDLQVAERDLKNSQSQIAEQMILVHELGRSVARMQANQDRLDEEMPLNIQAALEAEERALEALEAQLRPVTLLAPMDGFVSLINRRTGENVQAGEPILTISSGRSNQIIAYLRLPFHHVPEAGQVVEVRSRPLAKGKALSEIVRVGNQLEPVLPELLPRRPNNQLIEYGLPVLVQLPPQLPLVPGELVDIHWVNKP